eukprot:357838-Chlamydomonas_euryale.AAC.13
MPWKGRPSGTLLKTLLHWNLRSPNMLDIRHGLALAVAGVANVVQPFLVCEPVAGECYVQVLASGKANVKAWRADASTPGATSRLAGRLHPTQKIVGQARREGSGQRSRLLADSLRAGGTHPKA